MSKYKAVLFDFDGTLMNTNNLIMGSWQHLFRTLTGHEGDEQKILKSFGETLEYSMTHMFPDEDPEKCMDIYRQWQKSRYAEEIELFPGMAELIHRLHEMGYKLAMVSARVRSSMEEGLAKFGLLDYFDAVVGCDDNVAAKPSPEPALCALGKLGVEPSEALMLGDTKFDMGCAKNAGVTAVLVGWSQFAGSAFPKEFEPDYRVAAASDLLRLLGAK